MAPLYIQELLEAFILNQRKVNSDFRKETGMHRTHLEILSFANTVVVFNLYQLQNRFIEMNLQQARLGLRKLISIGALELWSAGFKNKPSVYIISEKGKVLLADYKKSWFDNIDVKS